MIKKVFLSIVAFQIIVTMVIGFSGQATAHCCKPPHPACPTGGGTTTETTGKHFHSVCNHAGIQSIGRFQHPLWVGWQCRRTLPVKRAWVIYKAEGDPRWHTDELSGIIEDDKGYTYGYLDLSRFLEPGIRKFHKARVKVEFTDGTTRTMTLNTFEAYPAGKKLIDLREDEREND